MSGSGNFTPSPYGKGLYGKGKYSRGVGTEDAYIKGLEPSGVQASGVLVPIQTSAMAEIGAYTRVRAAGQAIRVGFHVIDQPAGVQLSGEVLWQKVAVPACQPWFFAGLPANWTIMKNSAGAMFG